jgi:hypothetical protein
MQVGAVAHHIPTRLLLIVAAIETYAKKCWLWDAPRPGGNRYPVEECELARLEHLTAAVLVMGQTLISVVRQGDLIILSNDHRRIGVRLNHSGRRN